MWVRRLQIETGTHDDVQTGQAGNPLQRLRVAANPQVGGVDHCFSAQRPVLQQLFTRQIDIEQLTVVATDQRVHIQLAKQFDAHRALGPECVKTQGKPLL